MMNIEQEIDQLFALIETMDQCIADQQYIEFSEQQAFFSKKMQQVLTRASEDELLSVLKQLKSIKKTVAQTQAKSAILQTELKEKSLALKRGRKGVKAYK